MNLRLDSVSLSAVGSGAVGRSDDAATVATWGSGKLPARLVVPGQDVGSRRVDLKMREPPGVVWLV